MRLRPARARMVVGAEIADAEMRQHLEALGMKVQRAADAWSVTPPAWRFDIAIEEDLIEEVARLHGFDKVPEAQQTAAVVMPPCTETRVDEDRASDILIGRGYHEAITYSFVDHATQALFSPGMTGLRLANPISEELAEMRLSLWPGLVRALRENQRRQQPRVRLFECGRTFATVNGTLREVPVIAGLAAGPALPEQWGSRSDPVDYFDVRGDLEALIAATGDAGRVSLRGGRASGAAPGTDSPSVARRARYRLAGTSAPGARSAARIDIFGGRVRGRVGAIARRPRAPAPGSLAVSVGATRPRRGRGRKVNCPGDPRPGPGQRGRIC